MVKYSAVCLYMVLSGAIWHRTELPGSVLPSVIPHGVVWYCMALRPAVSYSWALYCAKWRCTIARGLVWTRIYCTVWIFSVTYHLVLYVVLCPRMILYGTRYRLVNGTKRYCELPYGRAWYCEVMHSNACYCFVLFGSVPDSAKQRGNAQK